MYVNLTAYRLLDNYGSLRAYVLNGGGSLGQKQGGGGRWRERSVSRYPTYYCFDLRCLFYRCRFAKCKENDGMITRIGRIHDGKFWKNRFAQLMKPFTSNWIVFKQNCLRKSKKENWEFSKWNHSRKSESMDNENSQN